MGLILSFETWTLPDPRLPSQHLLISFRKWFKVEKILGSRHGQSRIREDLTDSNGVALSLFPQPLILSASMQTPSGSWTLVQPGPVDARFPKGLDALL